MRMRLFLTPFLVCLLPTATLIGCATSTNLITGDRQRSAYSWEEEVQIGRQADQQVIAQYGLYDDPELAAYVNRIAQAVLETSAHSDPATPAEIRSTPFTFRVLDSPVVNAFALPGGYIYLTRGLLAHLNNEAQLAVVLGHEIGHVLGRHASRRAATQQLGSIGLLGAAILGEAVVGRGVGEGILNYGGTGVQLLFLRYSRDDEREADRAGVAYAEFAGYDAAEAAAFFDSLERLGQQSGGSVPGFLSTHPDPADREQAIPQLAAQYDGTIVNAEPFLAQLEGVVLGEDPRQGFTEGNTFYHPQLRFSFDYPSGWQVNNAATAVQIGEPNGRAVLEFTFAQESTAEGAGRAFASQEGLQVAERNAVSVNGNQAYRVVGTATTQQGSLAFIAYFIEYGGQVYRFTGLTAADAFRTYRSPFENSIRSFDRLTNAGYLNRQPTRLDLVSLQRPTAFRSLLSGRDLPPGLDEEGLAILNQLSLPETISSGERVKLPGR